MLRRIVYSTYKNPDILNEPLISLICTHVPSTSSSSSSSLSSYHCYNSTNTTRYRYGAPLNEKLTLLYRPLARIQEQPLDYRRGCEEHVANGEFVLFFYIASIQTGDNRSYFISILYLSYEKDVERLCMQFSKNPPNKWRSERHN